MITVKYKKAAPSTLNSDEKCSGIIIVNRNYSVVDKMIQRENVTVGCKGMLEK